MIRFAVTLLAAAAALLLAPAARAVDPLELNAASPANGAFVPPTPTGGVPFAVRVTGPPPGADMLVTVATSPSTGPNGTLPTDNRVDSFALQEDPDVPGSFAGSSDPGPNAWSENVGAYYWQAVATWTDAANVFHSAATPVQTLSIGTAPPTPPTPAPGAGGANGGTGGGAGGAGAGNVRTTLTMSSLDAPFYIRKLIRQRTKRTPVGLHFACKRLNSRSFRCRPTWRDSRNAYSATTATFTHTRSGQRVVARATLSGRRASRTCTRRRSVQACGVRFKWTATLAGRPIGSGTARATR
jgi:hypothetical protein